MHAAIRAALAALIAVVSTDVAGAGGLPPAKVLFGAALAPASLAPASLGFYSRGCLAGAAPLPIDGPGWQVMRLSRNRNWGTPALVAYIEKLASDAQRLDGWPGLLIGDMSQPRGGPMLSGHASHQVGLDVDIWFDPMPPRRLTAEEREAIAARSYIKPGTNVVLDEAMWTDAHTRLLRRAASYDEVQRIFVNAGVKKELCETAGSDRAWLHKIRPWYLHEDHFHVRLFCPEGMPGCTPQDAVPAGDGCGANLAWWLSPARYRPASEPTRPVKPKPPMTLAALPDACAAVLAAPAAVAAGAVVNIPLPALRPAFGGTVGSAR